MTRSPAFQKMCGGNHLYPHRPGHCASHQHEYCEKIRLKLQINKSKTIEILKLPFLTVGCSFIRTRNVTEKNGLKLIHPRIDKGQWRVTVRYNGTRGNVRVGIFLHEKIKKLLTNFFGWRYRRAETSALQYLPLFPNVPQLTAHHHPSFLVESQHWIHKKKTDMWI